MASLCSGTLLFKLSPVKAIVANKHNIRVRNHSCKQVLISMRSVKDAVFYHVHLSLGGLQQSLMMLTPPVTKRVTKILCNRGFDDCKFRVFMEAQLHEFKAISTATIMYVYLKMKEMTGRPWINTCSHHACGSGLHG